MTNRAVVTGTSGGIGQAVVQKFQSHGWEVFGIDLAPGPAGQDLDRFCQLDLEQFVLDGSCGEALLDSVNDWCGETGLDALVNVAAVQVCSSLSEIAMDDWHNSLNVNLLAPFLLVRSLLSHLEQAQGCVVNVSSIHARLTKPDFVVYSTTKAALSGMTRSMAVEVGARVRINAVEPAAVETDMLKASFDGRESQYLDLAACHPQGRLARPDEVANLIYSVVAGDFRFMHGACIEISGGIASRLHDPA